LQSSLLADERYLHQLEEFRSKRKEKGQASGPRHRNLRVMPPSPEPQRSNLALKLLDLPRCVRTEEKSGTGGRSGRDSRGRQPGAR
jgi:hypothetical protein